MTCAQLRTKTRTSISRKICCIKSGFQILYAVEQFSSLFSKDKLKQGAHIHQTHDPPSPRMSCGSQPTAPTCVVWSWQLKDSPQQEKVFYAMLMSETAVHGCHCPRDMAVRMREVMARSWVGVCVPLALIYW